MTSFLTCLPRSSFELIASFLSLEAKESLHQVCSAMCQLLGPSCYRSDAIDLDLWQYPQSYVNAVERRRLHRLIALLPHVASIHMSSIHIHVYPNDLPPGLEEGLVAAVKGRWLTDLSLEHFDVRMSGPSLGATGLVALAERKEDSSLSSLQWKLTRNSRNSDSSLPVLFPALVRCPRLTSLDIAGWMSTDTELKQLLAILPVSLTHFTLSLYPTNWDVALAHQKLLIDAFRSPSFLPRLTSLHSWHRDHSEFCVRGMLEAIATCPINDAGQRRPIQHLRIDTIQPDVFPFLAELTQVTKLEMQDLARDVDWVASTAALPSFLPLLHTVWLHPSHGFPAPRTLQSLLQCISTRPVRELSIRCMNPNTNCPSLTQQSCTALAAMRSLQTLTIAAVHSGTNRLTTHAGHVRLLAATGGWPALRHLDITGIALNPVELTAVVSAAPSLDSLKLCTLYGCSAVCIPIIGQHCAQLRELQLMSQYDRKRMGVEQLLPALAAYPPRSASLLPCLERLRVFLLDDAAVHLLLHRLRASPLTWIDVTPLYNSNNALWTNAFLVAVLCRCPSLRSLYWPDHRWRGPVLDVLTQRDVTSPTGLRFLQRPLPTLSVESAKAVEAVFRDDNDSRVALCAALRELLTAEAREMLQRWNRQEDVTEEHKAVEDTGNEVSAASLPGEVKEAVTDECVAGEVSGGLRRSKRRRG